ncbi:hypothetical protein [Klebsiella grimontii]|uniref:hypothetical protein n=1 Tax=Klebsiella grimontii TaxID=2058152 RepID=UPI003CE75ED3
MDKFDRTIQKEILAYLYEVHPDPPDATTLSNFAEKLGGDRELVSTMIYLHGHGLIFTALDQRISRRSTINSQVTKITAKGIDFIRDDGGLSAILNVQTIKFHREAVVVLEDLIAMSNMNDEQKEKAKSTLSELSTEALKTVVQAATTAGLSKLFGQ